MSDRINAVQLLLSGGVGAIIVEAIRALSQRKKIDADYAETISQSAIGLLKPLEARIKELEDELAKTKAEAERWRAEAMRERARFQNERDTQ